MNLVYTFLLLKIRASDILWVIVASRKPEITLLASLLAEGTKVGEALGCCTYDHDIIADGNDILGIFYKIAWTDTCKVCVRRFHSNRNLETPPYSFPQQHELILKRCRSKLFLILVRYNRILSFSDSNR